jgi:hypothetical protein
MKTGQSTTSFHPATGNPIMTSTTYNRSVAYATEESKTEHYNGSPGVAQGSKKRKGKGLWVRVLLGVDGLLPRRLRIVKSKRARYKRWYGWRTYVIALMINWRCIYKKQIMNKLGLRSGK